MKYYIITLLAIVFNTSSEAQNLYLGYGQTNYRSSTPIYNVNTFQVFGDFKTSPMLIGVEISNGETSLFNTEDNWHNFSTVIGVNAVNIREVGTSFSFFTSNNAQSVRGKLQAIDIGLGTSIQFKLINQIHFRAAYSLSAWRVSRGLDNRYITDAFSRFDSYSLSAILKFTQND